MNFLSDLSSWLKKIGLVLVIIEAASALAVGAFLGASLGEQNYWIPFFLSTLVYVLLLWFRLHSKALFTEQAVESLNLEQKLSSSDKELHRQAVLFTNLDHSVQRLNEETCSIGTYDQDQTSYLENVTSSLIRVAHPVVSNPNMMLQCNASSFSVLARVEFRPPGQFVFEKQFLVLRDDLAIGPEVATYHDEHDAVSDPTATGVRLEAGTFLKKVINENRYLDARYPSLKISSQHIGSGCTFIGIPIPLICDDASVSGVLFIVAGTSIDCCSEIPVVLNTYARLLANWLHHYSTYNYDYYQTKTNHNVDVVTGQTIDKQTAVKHSE